MSWKREGVIWEVCWKQEVGKELDPFDLICHVVFDQPALTRKERADNVKKAQLFHQILRHRPNCSQLTAGQICRQRRAGN